MATIKIYNEDIYPDYDFYDYIQDNEIVINGGHDYKGKKVAKWYTDLAELFSDFDYYNDESEAIEDLKGKYTAEQVAKLYSIYLEARNEFDFVEKALNYLSPNEYTFDCWRGCCQGEYVEVIYKSNCDWYADTEFYEDLYFGYVSEVEVYPDSEDDSFSYWDTIPNCKIWEFEHKGLKKGLADWFGISADGLKVYKQDGYTRTVKFEEIE